MNEKIILCEVLGELIDEVFPLVEKKYQKRLLTIKGYLTYTDTVYKVFAEYLYPKYGKKVLKSGKIAINDINREIPDYVPEMAAEYIRVFYDIYENYVTKQHIVDNYFFDIMLMISGRTDLEYRAIA